MASEFMSEARQAIQAQLEGIKGAQSLMTKGFFKALGIGSFFGKKGTGIVLGHNLEAGRRKNDIEIPDTSLSKDEYQKLINDDRLALKRKKYAFSVIDKDGTLISHKTDKKRFFEIQNDLKKLEDNKLLEDDLISRIRTNDTNLISLEEVFQNSIRFPTENEDFNILDEISKNKINIYNVNDYLNNSDIPRENKTLFRSSGYVEMAETRKDSESARKDLYALQRTADLRKEYRYSQKDPFKDFNAKKDTLIKVNQYCKDAQWTLSQINIPTQKAAIEKKLSELSDDFKNKMEEFRDLTEQEKLFKNIYKNHPKYDAKLQLEEEIKAKAADVMYIENQKKVYEQLSVLPKETITQEDVDALNKHIINNPVYKAFNDESGKETDFANKIHFLTEFQPDTIYSKESFLSLIKDAYSYEVSEELMAEENEKYLTNNTLWQNFREKYNVGLPEERKEAGAPFENDITHNKTEIDIITGEETQLDARYHDEIVGEKELFRSVVANEKEKDSVQCVIQAIKNETKKENKNIEIYQRIEQSNNYQIAEKTVTRIKLEDTAKRESEGNYKKITDKIKTEKGSWIALNVNAKNKEIICDNISKMTMQNENFLSDRNSFFVGSLKNINTPDYSTQSDYTIIMKASDFLKMDDFALKQNKANGGITDGRNYEAESIVFSNKNGSIKNTEFEIDNSELPDVDSIGDKVFVEGTIEKGNEITAAKEIIEKYMKDDKFGTVQIDVSPRIERNNDKSHFSAIDGDNLILNKSDELKSNVEKTETMEVKVNTIGRTRASESGKALENRVTSTKELDENNEERTLFSISLYKNKNEKDTDTYIAYICDRDGNYKKDATNKAISALFENGTCNFVMDGKAKANELLYDDFKGETLYFELVERVNLDGENEHLENTFTVVDMDINKELTADNKGTNIIDKNGTKDSTKTNDGINLGDDGPAIDYDSLTKLFVDEGLEMDGK